MSKNTVTCYCPECRQETLRVTITSSGQGFDPEWGATGYFSGNGVCQNPDCKWTGEYTDSYP